MLFPRPYYYAGAVLCREESGRVSGVLSRPQDRANQEAHRLAKQGAGLRLMLQMAVLGHA